MQMQMQFILQERIIYKKMKGNERFIISACVWLRPWNVSRIYMRVALDKSVLFSCRYFATMIKKPMFDYRKGGNGIL